MKKLFVKILFFIFTSQFIYGQISPGDLSNAHKDLEGMSNCTKCHALGEKVENNKCLDCHKEIKATLIAASGFHGSADVKNKECIECHSDHFGRNFKMIKFDKDKFDHSKTKFKITGKHSKIKCEECHISKFIKNEKIKKKEQTFLGLETTCESCHADFHQGTLSSKICTDCHNTEKWRPAPKFLHDKIKFKLIGSHKKVDCEKCHMKEVKEGKEFQKFTGLKFKQCLDCHKDIHKGKFGTNCEECHSVESFKNVKNIKSFDHSKTNFKLVGRHQNVTCNKCHTKGITSKLKYQRCSDCHSDFHKGEFKKKNKTDDCSVCHNENGFTPSLFTIANHEKAEFKLTGSHFAVPCNACHFVDEKWKFKFQAINCELCHTNIHKTSLNYTNGIIKNCESCHTTEKWNEIKFEHNKTKFALIGRHNNVLCSKCHFKDEKLKHQFVTVSTNCESCHTDKHAGQFIPKYQNDCSTCHSPESWKIENFDHSKTRFVLDGAHQKVKCAQCHKPIEKEGNKLIQYKFEDISCKSCHT